MTSRKHSKPTSTHSQHHHGSDSHSTLNEELFGIKTAYSEIPAKEYKVCGVCGTPIQFEYYVGVCSSKCQEKINRVKQYIMSSKF